MKQNTPRYAQRRQPAKAPARKLPWLSEKQQRALIVIFLLSFFTSLVLELYVFGFPDGFFVRWFSALMVIFLLISGTVLGIIPLVNYVSNRWLRF
ncbi:DUF2798 domain-containing protein [Adhaeribacter soli]|uniref:DUF2798 domain-containing protein n=1 Tax=Adhaeribacter soli TaxID=2607655 RepID=A0A5N1J0Q7_9BACT|nr:DUF2798 domain-containing protein [Adhaeribacter soli]KAA9333813.1 DUF2798 domain-containing protein [Adhaeribacter soli]